MAQDPRLAVAQERIDDFLRACPAAPSRKWYGDHEALAIVHGDPQSAIARRAAQAILHGSLAEPDHATRRLDREDRRMSHRGTS